MSINTCKKLNEIKGEQMKKEHEKAPIRKAEYTYEELKEVYDNPHQPTAEEIKNTFIEDDEKVDISKLKI